MTRPDPRFPRTRRSAVSWARSRPPGRSRSRLRRRRPCSAAWWRAGACSCCSTTRGTRARRARCCPAPPDAWCSSPAGASSPAWSRPRAPARCRSACPPRRTRGCCWRPGWGRNAAGAEPAAVTELVQLCACLPLALSIACAPGRMPAAPSAGRPGGAAARGPARRARRRGGDGQPRAAFSWSYRQLGPGAARMFRSLAAHPGPDISARAAAILAGLPSRQAGEALAELTGASLLDQPGPNRFTSHPCCAPTPPSRPESSAAGAASRRPAALRPARTPGPGHRRRRIRWPAA